MPLNERGCVFLGVRTYLLTYYYLLSLLTKYTDVYRMPKQRVRDVGGPSPAAARVERCVNVTNSFMVRQNGSSAPATAQQRGLWLPLLLTLFCNQPCGHKQMDMPCLLLGQSRPDGQLVKVFLASLVRIVHDGTSQLVVAPAQCVVSMLVPLDMLQW